MRRIHPWTTISCVFMTGGRRREDWLVLLRTRKDDKGGPFKRLSIFFVSSGAVSTERRVVGRMPTGLTVTVKVTEGFEMEDIRGRLMRFGQRTSMKLMPSSLLFVLILEIRQCGFSENHNKGGEQREAGKMTEKQNLKYICASRFSYSGSSSP